MDTADYDAFAARYDAENAGSLLNAHYERPAMLDLAGEVAGRTILDAGCGSGPLTVLLRERGAMVTGIDASPAMIALARERLGDDVPLHVGDLAEPLPFADGAFDDVIASLVLHYLEDWDAPLAELRRVLRPGGRLIVSVNHPTVRLLSHPHEDYFATRRYFRRVRLRRRARGADDVASAVARDDRSLHPVGILDRCDRGAAAVTADAAGAHAAAHRERGAIGVPLLPLLCAPARRASAMAVTDFERDPLTFGPSTAHPLESLSRLLGGAANRAKRADVASGLALGIDGSRAEEARGSCGRIASSRGRSADLAFTGVRPRRSIRSASTRG